MSGSIQMNFAGHPAPSAVVLRNCSPVDVARAVIEDGRQQQPFYIFDMDETYRHIQRFREKLPRVQLFYAMKANDSEMMIKLAIASGLGFDCASPGEIYKVRQFNVCPSSIIYAVTMKTPEQMMYARESGVVHTTFDSSCELKKLKQHWPDARLLIRIRIDSDSVYKLGEKFGCDFETEAADLLEEAASLGLTVIGVAFHVGSACFGIQSYMVGLQQAKALFEHESRAGRGMRILDIGGGFFGCNERFNQVSKLISVGLEELFPDPDVQIIAEPGRYLCESAFTLYSNINNVRTITESDKALSMIYINCGIHGTLRSFEKWHTISKLKSSADVEGKICEAILCGPTDDSRDRMSPVQLPQCSPLDWLVFSMQGSYTYSFGSKFSGFERPMIRPVISTELWNKLKHKWIFSSKDFFIDSDISEPLPSTLPPLLPQLTTDGHLNIPALYE